MRKISHPPKTRPVRSVSAVLMDHMETSTAMVRHSAIIFFMKKSLRLSFFSVFVPYPCSDSLDVIEFSI